MSQDFSLRLIQNLFFTLIFLASQRVVSADEKSPTAEQIKFFETKIRPVLVEHCYECHSTESGDPGGNLLLDSRNGMMKGGLTGPAHVAGDPENSLLIRALRYDEVEMPPDEPLPEAVINDFVTWVRQGAFDPRTKKKEAAEHLEYDAESLWSFVPRLVQEPPAVDSEWSRSPIDQFVLKTLQEQQLSPTQDADPRTLIKRLSIDLTGLAPTYDAVELFVAKYQANQAEAVEELVDQLLASPQFGVRWGRHWLDVARYGESNGNDGLSRNASFPHAWRYRDYVVDAFNEDVPYDRFLTEQIAGDLLPAKTATERNRLLTATGFLAIGSKPASAMNKNFAMDIVDDQINTVSTAVMGLSVACARCHDHKHDPIPTRDYYAMAGIFSSTETLYGAAGNEKLTAPPTPLHELLSKWSPDEKTDWSLSPKFPETYSALVDRLNPDVHISFRNAPEKEQLSVEGKKTAFSDSEYAQLKDATLKGDLSKPGTDYSVSLWFKNNTNNSERAITAYLFSRGKWKAAKLAGDHLGIGGKHDSKRTGKLFVFNGNADTVSIAGNTVIAPKTWNHVVLIRKGTNVKLFLNGAKTPEIDAEIPPTIGETTQFILADRSDHFSPLDGSMAEFAIYPRALQASEALQLFEASGQPQRPYPVGLAMGVREKKKPQDTNVHIGGQVSKKGDVVPRGFLTAYHEEFAKIQGKEFSASLKIPEKSSGRLELAEWLTHPDHPQTSRVIVNRVWSYLFGHGLVSTVDDFGVYGARPTHPELLDYLANRFVREGWSIKKLIRTLVLTRTYQLDSLCDESLASKDPGNTYFARYSRRRLDAESIRDCMLQASGELNYEPRKGSPLNGVDALINKAPTEASQFHTESNHRSLYLCLLRHASPPELAAFDLPDGVKVAGRRSESVLPTQTLYLMNSPFVLKQSKALADYILKDSELSESDRIVFVFRRVLQRNPDDFELHQARELIQSMIEESEDNDQLNAWTTFSQAMLITNEFRYVD